MPTASMTAQGSGSAVHGGARVSVDLRVVNQRAFEARVRVPESAGEGAVVVEELLRKGLVRGRAEATVTLEGSQAVRLDREKARAWMLELRSLRDEIAPREAVPMTLLNALPGVLGPGSGRLTEDALTAIVTATRQAVAAAQKMREVEGEALARDLAARCERIEAVVRDIEPTLPAIVRAVIERTRLRVQALGVELDPTRLAQEVVLLADRTDVSEEFTRLRSHLAQVRATLAREDDEPRGKRLEFLCQELAREANTFGQKTADLALAHTAIEIKVEIERMREQVQNIL